MIRSDVHMHSDFSSDSKARPETMIEAAIEKGLEFVCFTDHYDKDNFDWGAEDIFDVEDYFRTFRALQEKYQDQIEIRIGAELGIQPHLAVFYKTFADSHPFDFLIGSAHSVRGCDVATKKIFQGRSDEEAYRICFEEMLEDVRSIRSFDVLGHLDYVVRYSAMGTKSYECSNYFDIIDEILRTLIGDGRGIELNLSGFKYGLPFAHPHPAVLKRYRELGGEILTVGSDAHMPEHIAYDFYKVKDILEECGFRYYTRFRERSPVFVPL